MDSFGLVDYKIVAGSGVTLVYLHNRKSKFFFSFSTTKPAKRGKREFEKIIANHSTAISHHGNQRLLPYVVV